MGDATAAVGGQIGEMLQTLSSSMISTEDEAAVALQVSNALTQALLSFRLRSNAGEVSEMIKSVQKLTPQGQMQVSSPGSASSSHSPSAINITQRSASSRLGKRPAVSTNSPHSDLQDVPAPNQNLFQGVPPPNQNILQGVPPLNQNLFQGGPPQDQNIFQGVPPPNQNIFQGVPPPNQNIFQGVPSPDQNIFRGVPPPEQNVSHGVTQSSPLAAASFLPAPSKTNTSGMFNLTSDSTHKDSTQLMDYSSAPAPHATALYPQGSVMSYPGHAPRGTGQPDYNLGNTFYNFQPPLPNYEPPKPPPPPPM